MAYQNIIFDLDGTLIDSARLTGSILDQMLADRKAGTRADRNMIRTMDAVGGQAMIAAVLGSHTLDPAADLDEFRRRHHRLEVPRDILFPNVADTLFELAARGVAMAICSNKPQGLCDKILEEIGISHYFNGVFGSAPGLPRKPDPACAGLALGTLGTGATLLCGDSTIDVQTADAVGVSACLVAWGYGTSHARAAYPAVQVINSMADLLKLTHDGVT